MSQQHKRRSKDQIQTPNYGSCTESANASFQFEANSTENIIFTIETGKSDFCADYSRNNTFILVHRSQCLRRRLTLLI